MKKTLILSTLLATGLSANLYAKTFDFDVKVGSPFTEKIHLEKADVVMLHTSVPVGHPFFVSAQPENKTSEAIDNFSFVSSLGGVNPERYGEITDYVVPGASPGWVSYTFTGEMPTDAVFSVSL